MHLSTVIMNSLGASLIWEDALAGNRRSLNAAAAMSRYQQQVRSTPPGTLLFQKPGMGVYYNHKSVTIVPDDSTKRLAALSIAQTLSEPSKRLYRNLSTVAKLSALQQQQQNDKQSNT